MVPFGSLQWFIVEAVEALTTISMFSQFGGVLLMWDVVADKSALKYVSNKGQMNLELFWILVLLCVLQTEVSRRVSVTIFRHSLLTLIDHFNMI